ncbi:putative hydrolase of the HAD superfamily [Marivita hallyeonensis]|uniref:Putative hydrolase of the HAD superfamily n=2 Tax=Marivita hallyeonensis TaxID=996342 RepID=A0A1M5N3D3_9RHOB|nr:putative hydrolase of the HAD superfamily [Marivita hallyeonensis]
MTVNCLMLDVDGVLVDGRPNDGLRWDHDLQKHMKIPTDVLVKEFFEAEWNDIVVGKKALLPTLAGILRRIAPTIEANDLVAYWFKMDSRVVEPVLSDIRAARRDGISVYLATNQEHMRAAYLMEVMRLSEDVDGIVYSAQARSKKPQPEFFRFAENAVGRRPHELLLVDDTMPNVSAAQSEGWNAVHWDRTEELRTILQRHIKN